MPASQYGKYTIISRPRLDKNRDVWLPYSCIAADGDGRNYYYRQFMDLNTTFKTEEQALTYGFIVARAWIDEPYNTPGGGEKGRIGHLDQRHRHFADRRERFTKISARAL